MEGTKLNNPTDPLGKTEESRRELFKRFGQMSSGFSTEDVIAAAANILVNAIRQAHATKPQAEARFNELTGRLKGVLLDHYDGVTGKRRNIFPFTQHINVPLVADKDRMN
jgi:hypothetical protein